MRHREIKLIFKEREWQWAKIYKIKSIQTDTDIYRDKSYQIIQGCNNIELDTKIHTNRDTSIPEININTIYMSMNG